MASRGESSALEQEGLDAQFDKRLHPLDHLAGAPTKPSPGSQEVPTVQYQRCPMLVILMVSLAEPLPARHA
jgi:hypothetical protein